MSILVLDGHPDPADGHLVSALSAAYAEGARDAGHDVRLVRLGRLDLPLLRNRAQWLEPPLPAVQSLQGDVLWASHIVLAFPLWLGGIPAATRNVLEHLFREDFTFEPNPRGFPKGKLGGRSARLVVTMGMPNIAYRFAYGAHAVKALEHSILRLAGIGHVRWTLLGGIGDNRGRTDRLVERLRDLGRRGA